MDVLGLLFVNELLSKLLSVIIPTDLNCVSRFENIEHWGNKNGRQINKVLGLDDIVRFNLPMFSKKKSQGLKRIILGRIQSSSTVCQ